MIRRLPVQGIACEKKVMFLKKVTFDLRYLSFFVASLCIDLLAIALPTNRYRKSLKMAIIFTRDFNHVDHGRCNSDTEQCDCSTGFTGEFCGLTEGETPTIQPPITVR